MSDSAVGLIWLLYNGVRMDELVGVGRNLITRDAIDHSKPFAFSSRDQHVGV